MLRVRRRRPRTPSPHAPLRRQRAARSAQRAARSSSQRRERRQQHSPVIATKTTPSTTGVEREPRLAWACAGGAWQACSGHLLRGGAESTLRLPAQRFLAEAAHSHLGKDSSKTPMVRKTLTVCVDVPEGESSVKVARFIVGWLENPDNHPFMSIKAAAGDARDRPRSTRFKIKDRVWVACCGLSYTQDLELDANFTPDATAPRLVLVCDSPLFRHYSTTWQVMETTPAPGGKHGGERELGHTTLEVRGDVVIEPKRWSLSSALAVRHTLRYQEQLLLRLKRCVELEQELHRIAVVTEE